MDKRKVSFPGSQTIFTDHGWLAARIYSFMEKKKSIIVLTHRQLNTSGLFRNLLIAYGTVHFLVIGSYFGLELLSFNGCCWLIQTCSLSLISLL